VGAQLSEMGNLLSDPEYEMQTYARETRMRLRQLDRMISTQQARIFVAREGASDESDARLLVVLENGLDKLKTERVRAYEILNKIELGISAHTENEVIHDVKSMIQDIETIRDESEFVGKIDTKRVNEMMDQMATASTYALPLPPDPRTPSSHLPSQGENKD
jgi:hypothetical protein